MRTSANSPGKKLMLTIVPSTNRRACSALLSPERTRDAATDRRVARIVADVRRHGDTALRRYARALDRLDGPIEIGPDEIRAGAAAVPASVRAAIRAAARNIRAVARQQVPRGWRLRVAPGVSVEGRVIPLDRVGCYVPGGRYPLPSSLLMTAIPAAANAATASAAVPAHARPAATGG
jgi:histidinol dehydrogenase